MARPVPCRVLSHDPAIASASALAEIQPAFVVVVATAPQLDLVDGRLAPQSVRIDVAELDEPALIAPVARRSDEGAMSQIPQPDRALDRGRGIAGPRFHAAGRTWLPGVGEPLLRQVQEQRGQRPIEDRRIIARGDRVAEHVLGQPQLLERVAADRELDPVAVRRERRHGDWTDRQWMGHGTGCGSRNGNSRGRRRG